MSRPRFGIVAISLVLLQPTLALAQQRYSPSSPPPASSSSSSSGQTPPASSSSTGQTSPTQQKSSTPPTQQGSTPPTQQGSTPPTQQTPPKGQVSPTTPTVTTFPTIEIPQAIDVTSTAVCFVGSASGAVAGTATPIQFVGNVLCLDPGPNGDFASFASNCASGTTPAIQSVILTKTEPRIPKCPDVFPGGTFTQTAQTTGIRTWWTLKFSPCDTLFQLQVTFACVGATNQGRTVIQEVRTNIFNFKVTVPRANLSPVLQALHNEPLGVCEVPCITDEALFNNLLGLARTIRLTAAAGQSQILQLNQALDQFEAAVVASCFTVISVAQVNRDKAGNISQILPCGVVFPNGPPGNATVGPLGFGIVDSLENPCCCKLIADIFCLKRDLIGNSL